MELRICTFMGVFLFLFTQVHTVSCSFIGDSKNITFSHEERFQRILARANSKKIKRCWKNVGKGYCRASDGSMGVYIKECDKKANTGCSYNACKRKCENTKDCSGIEWHNQNCEIHTGDVSKVKPKRKAKCDEYLCGDDDDTSDQSNLSCNLKKVGNGFCRNKESGQGVYHIACSRTNTCTENECRRKCDNDSGCLGIEYQKNGICELHFDKPSFVKKSSKAKCYLRTNCKIKKPMENNDENYMFSLTSGIKICNYFSRLAFFKPIKHRNSWFWTADDTDRLFDVNLPSPRTEKACADFCAWMDCEVMHLKWTRFGFHSCEFHWHDEDYPVNFEELPQAYDSDGYFHHSFVNRPRIDGQNHFRILRSIAAGRYGGRKQNRPTEVAQLCDNDSRCESFSCCSLTSISGSSCVGCWFSSKSNADFLNEPGSLVRNGLYTTFLPVKEIEYNRPAEGCIPLDLRN